MIRPRILGAIVALALCTAPALAMTHHHMEPTAASSPAATDAMSNSGAMSAKKDPIVGGAPMSPKKNIIQNAVNSKEHTTLVAAVKAAGLVPTLSGPGPFTVFAPTDRAFARLPKGTVAMLLKPENKDKLTAILTYHVVAGSLDSKALEQMIADGHGTATLKTVNGEPLTVKAGSHDTIDLIDAKGNFARVTVADVYQSNGVIHVVNTVLLP